MSSFSRTLGFLPFARTYLYQANGIRGVATADPLYINSANWVNPQDLSAQQKRKPADDELDNGSGEDKDDVFPDRVKILAFNPAQPALNLPEVNQQLTQLTQPDSVLFDRLSQSSLGPLPELMTQQDAVVTIMGNRRTQVVGLFQLGSTLFTKGHVIMSDWTYGQRFGQDQLKNVHVGLLTLDSGADPIAVQARLRDRLPESLAVLTREELIC